MTDLLKNIQFAVALFIVGAFFILLGLSGGLTLGENSLLMQDFAFRIISLILGIALASTAVFFEYKSRPAKQKATIESAISSGNQGAMSLRADTFFFTLDDENVESFPVMVKDSVRIQILGRTAVNLLGQYQRVFEQLGNSGCEIQLLFVDPESDASSLLYGSNPDIYRSNIISACRHLNNLRQAIGHRLQVRVTQHAPTISILTIEKNDVQKSFSQVQLYFLHGAVGRDRPIFRVNYDDKWYGIFRDEFVRLWNDSAEWDVSRFLETSSQGG
jgi:hypothetical protein